MNRGVRQLPSNDQGPSAKIYLGPLEEDVMDVVWGLGSANVREVTARMERNLAYTTVMTTLDRLFKKGMLDREMTDRAFVYRSKITREEYDRQRADALMVGFLTGSEQSQHVLLSSLVDAVGTHDAMLLDELERKIRNKREELAKQE